MKGIELKDGCVIYYGNAAGYVEKDSAVVDTMFRGAELESWLAGRNLIARWTDGVYDRLTDGSTGINGGLPEPVKSCRIWQLKPNVDVRMKFIGYREMAAGFGEPRPEDYTVAYDGQMETNDLEAIYNKFNMSRPHGFTGHSLSLSDVIELYDQNGSEFHYVDRGGFRRIGFTERDQSPDMTMIM